MCDTEVACRQIGMLGGCVCNTSNSAAWSFLSCLSVDSAVVRPCCTSSHALIKAATREDRCDWCWTCQAGSAVCWAACGSISRHVLDWPWLQRPSNKPFLPGLGHRPLAYSITSCPLWSRSRFDLMHAASDSMAAFCPSAPLADPSDPKLCRLPSDLHDDMALINQLQHHRGHVHCACKHSTAAHGDCSEPLISESLWMPWRTRL
jgi:hypothetical protein